MYHDICLRRSEEGTMQTLGSEADPELDDAMASWPRGSTGNAPAIDYKSPKYPPDARPR